MFIVNQERKSAYRADRIISVDVYYKDHGFMDGYVYATFDVLPPEVREVELGLYDSAATACKVAKALLEAITDGYLDLFYMPEHNWDPAENAELFTSRAAKEDCGDDELDMALLRAKP